MKEHIAIQICVLLCLHLTLVLAVQCPYGQTVVSLRYYEGSNIKCQSNVTNWVTEIAYSDSNNESICYINDVYSENCTMSCKNETCNGDNLFCTSRICDPNSICYCKSQKMISKKQADCGLGWFTYDNEVDELSCAESTFIPNVVNDEDINSILSTDIYDIIKNPSNIIIKIRKSERIKYLNTIKVNQKIINGPIDVVDNIHNINDEEDITIDLDHTTIKVSAYLHDGSMDLWTRSDYQQPPMSQVDLCNAGKCEFCETNASYLNCEAFMFGYLKLLAIIVGIVFFLILLPWVIACCVVIVRMCQCICAPALHYIKKKRRESMINNVINIQNQTHNFNDTDNDIEMSPPITRRGDDTRPLMNNGNLKDDEQVIEYLQDGILKSMVIKKPRANVQMYIIILLFTFSFLPRIDAQCSSSVIASSSVNECVRYNTTHQSCKIRPVLTAAIRGLGDTSCIDVSVNGTRVGKIKVSFSDFVVKNNLVKEYYTSSWDPLCESSKSCFLEQCCTYDSYGDCGSWANNRLNDPNPCNKFSNGIMSVPGWTDCYSGNGCAGCNCFSCANACMYYRYAFRPKGNIATLYSFGLSTYQASLTISWNFTESGGISGQSTISTTNPYFSNNIFDFTLQGVFIDFAIGFGDKRLFAEGSTSKFVDAAKTNQPAKGIIGDIQASNANSLQNPSSNSFRYASNLVRISQDCSRSYCTFEGPGYNYKDFFPNLPQSLSGFNWEYQPTSQTISAKITRSLTAQYTLRFKNDVQILLFSDTICPKATFVKSSGCFQCTDGANITLRVSSDCLPGTCAIFSNSSRVEVVTTSVTLTNTPTDIIVVINSGQADLNDKLYINCRGNIISVNVTGTLIDKDTIYKDQNVTVILPPDSGSSADLGGLFGLGEDIAAIIILVIVIIGAILLFLLIAYLIYKCGCCCKGKNNNTDGNFSTFGKTLKTMMGITAIQAAIKSKKLKNAGYKNVDNTDDTLSMDEDNNSLLEDEAKTKPVPLPSIPGKVYNK